MSVIQDFSLARYDDGALIIGMIPPTPVGGWNIQFSLMKHLGGSGFVNKIVTSGFNNLSGISVTNSGQGVFNISLQSQDTSGLPYGNYPYAVERMDSGFRTTLTEGYVILLPSVG